MGQAPVSRYGLLLALRQAGADGLTRRQIGALFPHGVKASQIDGQLERLAKRGHVRFDGERWVAQ
jgi:hypothetical protein